MMLKDYCSELNTISIKQNKKSNYPFPEVMEKRLSLCNPIIHKFFFHANIVTIFFLVRPLFYFLRFIIMEDTTFVQPFIIHTVKNFLFIKK